MVWLRRVLLGLLTLILASQFIIGLQAWRDEAVAASWIVALEGKRECFGDFTSSEALHLEQLATVNSLKLSANDRLRVDCYLRDVDRRRTVERASRDLIKAQTTVKNALIIGAASSALIAILVVVAWINCKNAIKFERRSPAAG